MKTSFLSCDEVNIDSASTQREHNACQNKESTEQNVLVNPPHQTRMKSNVTDKQTRIILEL